MGSRHPQPPPSRPEPRRLLITGVSGFMGAHAAWRLHGEWDVVGTVHMTTVGIPGVRTVPMDLSDRASVRAAVDRVRPAAILHTAALTHPDRCEHQPVMADAVNVYGTAALAETAHAWGARLLFLSTDLVFDGREAPYREGDRPSPLSHYGRTKVRGERIVQQLGPLGAVLRTSIVYGWPKGPHGSFLDWLLAGVRGPEPVRLFTDQRRAFLYIGDCVEMFARVLAEPSMPSLIHLAGGEAASRYRFGEEFCEVFGYPATQIAEMDLADMAYSAPRPLDCSLVGDAFARRYGFRARNVWAGLQALAAASPAAVFGPRPLGRA